MQGESFYLLSILEDWYSTTYQHIVEIDFRAGTFQSLENGSDIGPYMSQNSHVLHVVAMPYLSEEGVAEFIFLALADQVGDVCLDCNGASDPNNVVNGGVICKNSSFAVLSAKYEGVVMSQRIFEVCLDLKRRDRADHFENRRNKKQKTHSNKSTCVRSLINILQRRSRENEEVLLLALCNLRKEIPKIELELADKFQMYQQIVKDELLTSAKVLFYPISSSHNSQIYFSPTFSLNQSRGPVQGPFLDHSRLLLFLYAH